MDQHRRGTHPNEPLCCHDSHLAAAGSICSKVAHWSGGGTALCVWCSCRDLFGGEVLMVRWAARRVYTLQLQLQLTNTLYMTLKQYPCIRTVCTAGVNWYVSVNSPYLCVLSRSPCAYDSLAVCITRHMSNSLHVLSSPFLYLYRSHCIAAKWRERLMVCLSPSNWVHTSLNNSGADEGDRSSFFVSHSSSDNPEATSSQQTDSRFFRNTGNNWMEYAELRESLLDQESLKRQ